MRALVPEVSEVKPHLPGPPARLQAANSRPTYWHSEGEVTKHRGWLAKREESRAFGRIGPQGESEAELLRDTEVSSELAACFFFFLLRFYFIFSERGREGERKGEKHQRVKETGISCLLHTPSPGLAPNPHVP
ncbi:hypothetical protein HJG60_009551 [Phyllostomus discolor]|uniref:Uncharacterized protein n=1 Tax=Phyllostomus discolor TaxID=89673 RepID=A0A833YFF7_9CHIR|nr:hypothetical protein HJG60_009551 [Phyllostomus discolor]